MVLGVEPTLREDISRFITELSSVSVSSHFSQNELLPFMRTATKITMSLFSLSVSLTSSWMRRWKGEKFKRIESRSAIP